MLKRITFPMAFLLTFIAGLDAMAFNLEKGTISLGGGSTFSFANREYDGSRSSNSIGLSFTGGYFIIDNLEIGGGLDMSYFSADDYEMKGIMVSPYVTYHFDLNETSNIFISGMAGFGKSDSDSDYLSSESDQTSLSAEIGWEYFFTPSVSSKIGAKYRWEEERGDDDWDIERKTFSTVLGLKFYF
jgi:long-subunit fatty acid transport protein